MSGNNISGNDKPVPTLKTLVTLFFGEERGVNKNAPITRGIDFLSAGSD
ncbi:MAG: hypothetical protein HYR67_11340 [Bacteroidetes bacterium]|nr:hypothetical protein [Bacteroidota bacterium]